MISWCGKLELCHTPEKKKKKSITSRMGPEVDFSLKCKNPHAAAGVKMLCSFSCQAYLIDFVCRSRASASCTGSFFNINIKPAGNPWRGMLDEKHQSITKCLHKTVHMPKQGQRLNQQSSSVHFKFICKCKKGRGKKYPFYCGLWVFSYWRCQ